METAMVMPMKVAPMVMLTETKMTDNITENKTETTTKELPTETETEI